jgi:hypothetical protein
LSLRASTSAKALTYFPYKCPHLLHTENHIKIEVISFQVFPLPCIVE